MKICIFGGTFDPPHIGHLLVAQTVCEAENFDKILFMPANKPPHKKNISGVKDRLNMLNIAIEGNLPLVILNGDDVANLRKAINGETFEGTNVYGVN